jgi:6-phosphogluconate dehydrogenase
MQDIGLIGLAVMGQNLVLNMAEKGYKVSVFNRTPSKTEEFVAQKPKEFSIQGFAKLEDFLKSLSRPRKVMIMVKAGKPVDEIIAQALPYLERGDILIDGGNSEFKDTERRVKELEEKGILFLGVGISGGEEGARHGPSIMPGGKKEAWLYVKDIFQSISAKVEGKPCCDWVGEGGAGHFVKMVHNGIEYADMQLIAETYDLLQKGCSLRPEELAALFGEWNKGDLESYLIEISAKIFAKKDTDGEPLVDKILDVAGQKGTGKWTVEHALELNVPVSLIAEAVMARNLSAMYELRKRASQLFSKPNQAINKEFIPHLEKALYAAKIISYAQGFLLMREASLLKDWKLNAGACALMWRGGCIIRSKFLGKIHEAYLKDADLPLLLFDPFFKDVLTSSESSLREVVAQGAAAGISLPCFSSALSWFDGVTTKRLPTNLIQAQRDFFGAHTFERMDHPRGEMFHQDWT